MSELPQKASGRKPRLSALRRRLKQPQFWLGLYAGLTAMAIADSFRSPPSQLTARSYVFLVHQYQRFGHPVLQGHVQCRFVPTCSDYSILAVRHFGIRRGLSLTMQRIARCRASVPLGTYDPLPAR